MRKPWIWLVVLGLLCWAGGVPLATAANLFTWTVESDTTSLGAVIEYHGATTRVNESCHGGTGCLKLILPGPGHDNAMGAEVLAYPAFSYGVNVVGAAGFYNRWWMKLMPGFSFGPGKMKSSRLRGQTDPSGEAIYTGYLRPNGFGVHECDGGQGTGSGGICRDASGTIDTSDSLIVAPYDMTSKIDGLWHEYIVFIKPNTTTSANDAEIKVWIDGVFATQYLNWHLHNYSATQMKDAWGAWMVRPYVQLDGSGSDGGTMYLDDFSVDTTFNTLTTGGGGSSELECVTGWETAHPTWIFCDDFESGGALLATGRYGDVNTDSGEFIPQTGVGVNGSIGMRGLWQPGEDGAGSLDLAFGRNPTYLDQGIHNTVDYRDVYGRVYVRTQAGWTGTDPGKLVRFIVFSASDLSEAAIAHWWTNGANVLINDPAACVTGSTVNCIGYNDFAHLQFLGIANGTTALFSSANADQWFCVEFHMKLNDAGMSNGIQEFWVNGNLEAQQTTLNFVGSYAAYGINALYLENFWNVGSPATQARYFDNLVVATTRIGCLTASTAAPTSLRLIK